MSSLLADGVGIAIVDLLAPPERSLHAELLAELGETAETEEDRRYLSAYRRRTGSTIDIWYEPVQVGQPLPTLAVPLMEGPVISLPLGPIYEHTLRRLRIDVGALAKLSV